MSSRKILITQLWLDYDKVSADTVNSDNQLVKILTRTQYKIEFTYESKKPPNFKVVIEW